MNDIKDVKKYIKENQINIDEIIKDNKQDMSKTCDFKIMTNVNIWVKPVCMAKNNLNNNYITVSFSIDELLKQMQNFNLTIDKELLKEKVSKQPIIHNNKTIGIITNVNDKFINGIIYKDYEYEVLTNTKNEITSISIEVVDK